MLSTLDAALHDMTWQIPDSTLLLCYCYDILTTSSQMIFNVFFFFFVAFGVRMWWHIPKVTPERKHNEQTSERHDSFLCFSERLWCFTRETGLYLILIFFSIDLWVKCDLMVCSGDPSSHHTFLIVSLESFLHFGCSLSSCFLKFWCHTSLIPIQDKWPKIYGPSLLYTCLPISWAARSQMIFMYTIYWCILKL